MPSPMIFSPTESCRAGSGPEVSSGTGANPLHDSLFKPVFLETGRFNREKTVQFSRVLFSVKKGTINWSCGTLEWPGMTLWPKNKGGSLTGKSGPVFRENTPDPYPSASYDGNRGIRMERYSGFEGFYRRCDGVSLPVMCHRDFLILYFLSAQIFWIFIRSPQNMHTFITPWLQLR